MAKNTALRNNITGTLCADTITQVSNGQLRTQLRTMLSCLEQGNKASWQYAYTLYRSIKSETYNEDFGSLSNYASYLNSTKGEISKKDNAVKFIIRENIMPYKTDKKGNAQPDFINIPTTVQCAYELSAIKTERTKNDDGTEISDSFADFKVFIDNEEPHLLSVAKVKELKKAFYESLRPKELTDGNDSTDSTDSTDSNDSNDHVEVKTKEDAIIIIKTLMMQFNITIEELAE